MCRGDAKPPPLPCDRAGLLVTDAPCSSEDERVGSAFCITARGDEEAGSEPERRVVFGRLIRGYGLLRELASLPGDGAAPAEARACCDGPVAVLSASHRSPHQVSVTACGEVLPGCDGAPPSAPDGDPLPRWPADWADGGGDGLGATTDDSWAARLGAAALLKALGNEAFARGDALAALAKYEKGLRYLERGYTREAERADAERSARASAAAAAAPLRLNAAAACAKLKRHREVVAHCEALGALPGPAAAKLAGSTKALLRHGVALTHLREFAAAEAVLLRAGAAAGAGGTAEEKAAATAALMCARRGAEERKRRERAAFAAAFGTGE